MIYRVLIYIAGLLILAMESYRRLRIVFTEVSDLRRTVLMCPPRRQGGCAQPHPRDRAGQGEHPDEFDPITAARRPAPKARKKFTP